ncbi:MAG TPA: metallophosphoesterase [bacterium]|nr:metallophosphoesterase [bacterium]HQI47070.1 metallophosphoesterase [bacterium]HQJ65373.1 metallophosphoesterase [bacterium]
MSTVKNAIVMSDLHLGRPTSYLHIGNAQYAYNQAELAAVLRRLGPQDEVVINGDFMELSLIDIKRIYPDVRAFFSTLAQAGPFQRLVYIPGNHDHHYWRYLSEQVYEKTIMHLPEGADSRTYPDFHVDMRYSSRSNRQTCTISLAELWPPNYPMPEFIVKYPHHLIRNQADGKNYLFTHGHFLEDRFRPVDLVIEPAHLEELEAFNNIWLEAFDYHLGHAGRFSDTVLKLLEHYEKGGKEAREHIKAVTNEIQTNMKTKLKLNRFYSCMLKLGFKLMLKKVPLERKSGLLGQPLTGELQQSIQSYIDKYLLQRYTKEMIRELHLICESDLPVPFIFVFAHTHRPVTDISGKNAVMVRNASFPILNTGGWVNADECGSYAGENAGILAIHEKGFTWESMAGRLK